MLNVLNELKLSKEEFDEIKVKCLKLSKKRSRLRRQTLKRKLQKESDKVNTQNLHFRIDNWQKEMQEVVERNKRVSTSFFFNFSIKAILGNKCLF